MKERERERESELKRQIEKKKGGDRTRGKKTGGEKDEDAGRQARNLLITAIK